MLSQVLVDRSDGFVDLRIPILHVGLSESGEVILTVGGYLSNQLVEVTYNLQPGMLPNMFFGDDMSINAHFDAIEMTLAGEMGSNFAAALSRLYGQSPRTSFLLPVYLSFTAVALAGDPAKTQTEIVKFKIFHETGSTDEEESPAYFEMFLNIDIPSGLVEWNEKDTDFRVGVLNSIPAKPS